MLVVHGTRKFLDRVGRSEAGADDTSTTRLGSWYATVLLWRPQVALFVNETTLLPVLMPLAPAASLLARFPAALERRPGTCSGAAVPAASPWHTSRQWWLVPSTGRRVLRRPKGDATESVPGLGTPGWHAPFMVRPGFRGVG